MDFLKTAGGKILGGLVSLAVVAAAISWWRTSPAEREAAIGATERMAAWCGIVLLVPWASFFLIAWVSRFQRNEAGAALVLVITAAELALLAALFHWSIQGTLAWSGFVLGGLVAGVYNLLMCDWIAEKLE
jgi:predicted tellurium resistance membrane protein TerC